MQVNSTFEKLAEIRALTGALNCVQTKRNPEIHDSKIYNRFVIDLEKETDLNEEVKFTFTVLHKKTS
jgi:hypothetical protein